MSVVDNPKNRRNYLEDVYERKETNTKIHSRKRKNAHNKNSKEEWALVERKTKKNDKPKEKTRL